MAKTKQTRVEAVPTEGPGSHRKVALFAALGLVVGVSWPVLAGKHLGPHVPGAKKDDDEPAVMALASASNSATAASASSASVELPRGASSAELEAAPLPATKHSVTVDGGSITSCWHGKEKLEGARCGVLKLDRTVVPNLRQLTSCPSALGLTGDLNLSFDIDFEKKAIRVKKGKKSVALPAAGEHDKTARGAELPNTTVTGILACVADYVRELQAEKIPHEHGRYLVDFNLHFRAHAEAPTAKVEEESAGVEEGTDAVASIVFDSALLRDEPRTGKTVARLVRGTHVKILGSRKDWFEVKMGNHQGWLYRSVIGR